MSTTVRIGDLEVGRLGYGAMRLPGPEVWGEPKDPVAARAVLKRAVELGINFIDTAWYYGPYVSNRLIAEALHPYPRDLVIATKLGGKRLSNKGWGPASRPEELRQGCEDDLRTLKLDRLDVVHFRYIPAAEVPFDESLGAMIEMKAQGKIRHIGLSNVAVPHVKAALAKTPIVTVQNLFNVSGGGGQLAKFSHAEVDQPEAVLDFCTAQRIAFLPFFPLAVGKIADAEPALARVAKKHDASVAQIAIAWLLARSPMMLPIPGTSSLAHLEENWAARNIKLDEADLLAIRGS